MRFWSRGDARYFLRRLSLHLAPWCRWNSGVYYHERHRA